MSAKKIARSNAPARAARAVMRSVPAGINGMQAFANVEESVQGSPFIASLLFMLSKKVEDADKGMLQALKRMAENYCWDSEARFVFEVGKIHIVPIGGELVEVFDEVLSGKAKVGTSAYRRRCARAYELWVKYIPLMRPGRRRQKLIVLATCPRRSKSGYRRSDAYLSQTKSETGSGTDGSRCSRRQCLANLASRTRRTLKL
jgi:hypothetical protein